MIPKINRILYATDLSRNSAYAFRYAANTAEKHDAKIDILHVIADAGYQRELDSLMGPFPAASGIKSDLKKEIQDRVDHIIQKEFKDKPEVMNRIASIQIIEGDPTVQILHMIDELKIDLLVLGTHSKGIIAHTFLGSVATQILQRTRVPIMVIPLPTGVDAED